MHKKIISCLICILLIFNISGCAQGKEEHKHSWVKPTCTEPIVCTGCDVTKGEALGHTFVSATCTTPATCARCGITEGEAIGHMFSEPSFTIPATCLVCGFTDNVYRKPEILEIARFDALYEASADYLIYREDDCYGVVDKEGKCLTEAVYDGFVTGLENDSFALSYKDEDKIFYDLYSSLGTVIFNTGEEYSDYKIVGMAGGYLTLRNEADNTWYYLDEDESFAPKAYIDARRQDKEFLSLASNDKIVAKNLNGVGYPYIDLETMSYCDGFINDTVLLDAVGSAVSQSGEMLASEWAETTSGDYTYIATGLYNVFTQTFEEIKGFYDENCLLKNIVSYDGSGINEVPFKDGFMLLQSGVMQEVPVYGIYNMSKGEFVSPLSVEKLMVGPYAAIAKVYNKYYYLDADFEVASDPYSDLTLFSEDGLALALRNNGKAYVINTDFAEISDGMDAKSISHRFKDYYIIGVEDGEALCVIR